MHRLRFNHVRDSVIIRGLAAFGIFVIFGFLALTISHAATYAVSIEAESGVRSGNQTDGDPNGASGRNSVKFGAVSNGGTLTNCVSHPGTCGYPDATSTGATGTLTSASGDVNLNVAGATYENVNLTGCITVNANNVTIINVRLACNGPFGILVNSTGVNISHSTVTCNNQTGATGIVGDNYTASTINVSECENGWDAGDNVTILDSYCHNIKGYDNDCVQGVMAKNTLIRHNTLITSSADNSAIEGDGQTGTTKTNWVVDNNILSGGGYTLYCPGRSVATGVKVTNNRFGSYNFGPLSACGTAGYLFTGNVTDATNAPLSAN